MTGTPRKRAPRAATPPTETPAADPAPTGTAAGPEPEYVPTGTAWARVMRDVGAIVKGDRNKDQGFNFRGIDATMNAVGPALRQHGVMVLPVGVEILESERYESKRGAAMHGMVTRHDWLILGPDGDPIRYPDGRPVVMQTLGQAADTSDKVATKASSVAYRTALLQSLTVPTGDRDPDADTHERAATDPRQEQWDRIAGLGRYAKQSPDAIRKHYREKMGHDIDGPDSTVESLTAYADRLEEHLRQQAEKLAAEQPAAATPEPEAAQEPPADEPNEPPADEPAPAGTDTAPEPQTATQGRGRDPRQALWDDILKQSQRLKWSAEQVRADFRQWAADAAPEGMVRPVEIDGEATPDLLTRYYHVLRTTEESTK